METTNLFSGVIVDNNREQREFHHASIEQINAWKAKNKPAEHLKKLVQFGNNKLPKTTVIFNMGPAKECPANALGLCELGKTGKCYAMKAERLYPQVLPYRIRQKNYWLQVYPNYFSISIQIFGNLLCCLVI